MNQAHDRLVEWVAEARRLEDKHLGGPNVWDHLATLDLNDLEAVLSGEPIEEEDNLSRTAVSTLAGMKPIRLPGQYLYQCQSCGARGERLAHEFGKFPHSKRCPSERARRSLNN